jgi:hypothetical protein
MGAGMGIEAMSDVLPPPPDARSSERLRRYLETNAPRDVSEAMPSSVIRSFSYNARDRTLDVLFVSGLRYRYADVPEDIAQDLAAAPSKGGYFNDHIRDRYDYERRRSPRRENDA